MIDPKACVPERGQRLLVINTVPREQLTIAVPSDATLTWIDVFVNQISVRHSLVAHLTGSGAQIMLGGMYVGGDTSTAVIHQEVVHEVPRTTSQLIMKGVLADAARATYTARIHILNTSAHATAIQRADMLLLSPNANAEVVPDLAIENNQVHCTHGVTISKIKKDILFYMQSRGITEREATALSVMAHVDPVLSLLPEAQASLVLHAMHQVLHTKE